MSSQNRVYPAQMWPPSRGGWRWPIRWRREVVANTELETYYNLATKAPGMADFGHWSLKNMNYISEQGKRLTIHERMALPRREASFRPGRARPSRDHSGTVSVRSKLPQLYVPASSSPVLCEDSRDLWRTIGRWTMFVFKLRKLLPAHPLRPQLILTRLRSCSRQSDRYIF